MVSRIQHWIASWRLDPWDLRSWRDQNRRYRWVISAFPLFAIASIYLTWSATGFHIEHPDLFRMAFTFAVTVFLGIQVFRIRDAEAVNPVAFVPIALVMAGYPAEALLSTALKPFIGYIRKPMPVHIVVFDAVHGVFWVSICAAVQQAFAGSELAPSVTWTITAYVVGQLSCLLDVFGPTGAAVLGGYVPKSQLPRAIASDFVIAAMVYNPLTLMIAALIAQPSWWFMIFLLVPYSIGKQLFQTNDELVEARTEAQIDPLTGLLNRRALTEVLEAALVDSSHPNRLNWLLLCDLDNFKRLNDTQGHEAGDEALRRAARCMREATRSIDRCARYGGEEFVLVLKNVGESDVAKIAERLRNAIEHEIGEMGTTASIGAYSIQQTDTPLEALGRADAAMYSAKISGKNRVVFWSPELEHENDQATAA